MATDIQWVYITDKYALVEIIDNAILVATFNQKPLKHPLIKARAKILSANSYDELATLLNLFLELKGSVTDKRLVKIVEKLIEQLTSLKESRTEFKEKVGSTIGSKVSD